MLRAAVIGCGRMGAEPSARLQGLVPPGWLPIAHAECLGLVDGVELAALADTDRSRLDRHGAHYRVSALYTDYRELMREVRPEVVTIATRTPSKPEIVSFACANGAKAVYVEKPIANSLADCRRVLAEAARTGTVVGYGVNRRFHHVYRQARELLDNGEIGELREITAEFGRSQLLWTHPHSMDLILFFARTARALSAQASLAPESVALARDSCMDSDPLIEHAHFTLDRGIRATVGVTGGCTLRLGGEKGTLTVRADGAGLEISRGRGPQRGYFLDQTLMSPLAQKSATVVALQELVASIGGVQGAPIAPAEIEGGLAMLLACAWSHVNGGTTVVPEDVPADFTVTGRYHEFFA